MPVSLLLLKSLCSLKHGFHQQCKYNHNWNSSHLQWKQLRHKHKDQNFSFFFFLFLALVLVSRLFLWWIKNCYTCCSTCIYDCVSTENQALIYIYIDDKVCFPSCVVATVCYHNDSLFEGHIIPKVFLHSSSYSESSGEKTHDTWKKSAICVQRERSSE